ncbi:MAG: Dot/Icm secretion system protein IcmQ [Legionellaceae bacterium]|nr:Dot/Icm secretion system protein IcmQ [Legionellaceae bacterium]
MKKNKLSEKQVHTVLDALRELLEQGPWNNSAFLRVLGKKIQKSHDDFAERAGRAAQTENHQTTQHKKIQAPSETQQEVFIALYASDGGKLESWEKILANLPQQAVSRPVYADQKAIEKAFKERRNHLNEAYVAIYIMRDFILPTPMDKTPKDRFGTELLTLKNKALALDNIMRFVHASGEYQYKKGRLIKMPDANSAG